MLIPDTLIHCIKCHLGVITLEPINRYRVSGIRSWSRATPEARAEHCRKMSERRLNMSVASKKKAYAAMRKGMKRYWKNISEEKRKAHIKAMSDSMKGVWEESRNDANHALNNKKEKDIKIIHDVPRINTYSGVITESQMQEIIV